MKILLLTSKSPWPPKDGGASATLALTEGLLAYGAKITIVSINTLKHFVSPSEALAHFGGNVDLKLITVDTRPGIPALIRNLVLTDYPYSLERFLSKEVERVLCSLNADEFDIVQIEGLAMTGYLNVLKRFSRARFIYRPHNVECRIWFLQSGWERNPLKRAYLRLLASRTEAAEKTIMKKFDGLASVTGEDMKWFINNGFSGKSTVCSPGYPVREPGSTEEVPGSVFFLGSLDWRPNLTGLEWFIRYVWPLVGLNCPGAVFHVAGRNPSARARHMCKGKNIVFHGEIGESSLFIGKMQVMVVPLFAGSGIRMKIIEGMSCGKGIVATSVAVAGMDLADGKAVFIKDDSHAFADSVVSLLNDASLRKEMGSEGMETVRKNYNIFASAEKLMNFYSQLV
ncbi:MAG TPA: glycosyltransferase family 4 protein [Bacteroidales bacterium]|nr:glycosyltransferase family 4 protein [Bacteroidales bacterium]